MPNKENNGEKHVVVVGVCPEGPSRYVALDFSCPPEIVSGRVLEVVPVERECQRDGKKPYWVKLLQAVPDSVAPCDEVEDTRIMLLVKISYRESWGTRGIFKRWEVVGGSGALLILDDEAVIETHGHTISNDYGKVLVEEKEKKPEYRSRPARTSIRYV
ncbi:MAG: hypothetical protein ABIB98_00520 [bacterium]